MCGISGIMNLDPARPISPATLVNMAAIQYHRGPDDYGWKTIEGRGVGMSHARLSIIDLHESGRQPFWSDDENLLMAHNGEFYDYKRIRTDLTARGYNFRTKSDSEIVMNLYPDKGFEPLLKDLRGEFGFSLYDKKLDRLYLVRDRFGIKPLYWINTGKSFVFGSEIKSILANPEVPREFYAEGVFHQLMQTIVPGSTPFKGINQVKPGHYLIVERRDGAFHIRETAYWDMDFPELGQRNDDVPEAETIEKIRELLIEAVQHRLEADVPVGCYLSGGIDSCSILGLAAASRQDAVKAFTIGFDNDSYDESAIAVEMARSVGADQDILELEADHLYDHFVKTHWHTERTIYNTLGVAKYLMSKHVHEAGYRVVVTGEGSDELFAGYPSFRRDMFLHGLDHLPERERLHLQAKLNESNALVKGSMLAAEEVVSPELNRICGFTPSCLQPWLACAPEIPGLLAPDIREQMKNYDPGAAIAAQINPDMVRNRHPLDVAQYVWIKTMLEGQILTWGGDRVDMANSMEARPAFLDHHLAEAAVWVPPAHRIKGDKEKYVLREAMKGVLPKVLYERQKFAFMAPPAHTDPKKLKALKDMAADFLSDEAIEKSGFLDKQGIKTLFERYESSSTPAHELVQLDALVNHVIGIQVLHHNFVQQDIPRVARETANRLGWHAPESSGS
ncbi:MAG: asparagine synthase (glutamine-hydrolyzing) [Leptospiraceae bacterium]